MLKDELQAKLKEQAATWEEERALLKAKMEEEATAWKGERTLLQGEILRLAEAAKNGARVEIELGAEREEKIRIAAKLADLQALRSGSASEKDKIALELSAACEALENLRLTHKELLAQKEAADGEFVVLVKTSNEDYD